MKFVEFAINCTENYTIVVLTNYTTPDFFAILMTVSVLKLYDSKSEKIEITN